MTTRVTLTFFFSPPAAAWPCRSVPSTTTTASNRPVNAAASTVTPPPQSNFADACSRIVIVRAGADHPLQHGGAALAHPDFRFGARQGDFPLPGQDHRPQERRTPHH